MRRLTWQRAKSEIVAGHHVEYSGFAFALFFLAEYIFMILIAALTSLMFLGGWLSPFPQSWALSVRLPHSMFVKNGGGSVLVPVDPCNLPALPLRPNHAFGLESADSDRFRLHRGFGRVDDFTAEFVEISFRRRIKVV